MEDVSITDLTFGQEYQNAVEKKQIAAQNAQRAALRVEQAKQEKQQKIVEAEAEAVNIKRVGEAVKNNPGFLNMRKIDAALDVADTMTQSQNRVFLDSTALMLDVNSTSVDASVLKGKGSGW